jgi:hypothetical protein
MKILFGMLVLTLFGTSLDAQDRRLPATKNSPASAEQQSPFVCNRTALSPAERKRHFDELSPMLLSLRTGVRELPNGYAFQFPADPKTIQLVAEWVAGEHACCPFFDIDITIPREGGPLWLSLSGRDGTKEFIKVEGASLIRQ